MLHYICVVTLLEQLNRSKYWTLSVKVSSCVDNRPMFLVELAYQCAHVGPRLVSDKFMKHLNQNGPSHFHARCCRRRLNLAVVFWFTAK